MKYPKVLNLGSPYTENALIGEVLVQEKVDGSQFRWGWNQEGKFYVSSKNKELFTDEGMFTDGAAYIRQFNDKPLKNTYFFAEYLCKPKHNSLAYERIPKNYLMLFDVYDGGWVKRHELETWANEFDIDIVPELYGGIVADVDQLKEFLQTKSYLGGTNIEGVCIKNYDQIIEVGGKLRPLFVKFVSKEFHEKHGMNPDHKSRKKTIDGWIAGFNTEARFQKAYQHLLEDGVITHELKDIGLLIKETIRDLEEECEEEIKDFLYEKYQRQIHSSATRGIPDWYKNKLLERLNEVGNGGK